MQTKVKEVEHSPSPQPARGIYGFIFASLCASFIVSYGLWIVIPADIIEKWPYQPPQKYWAAAVPIFFCTALFLFAFFIYPSLHVMNDGQLNESSAIMDSHTIRWDVDNDQRFGNLRNQSHNTLRSLSMDLTLEDARDKRVNELREMPIPSASDMDIIDISRLLYLNNGDD